MGDCEQNEEIIKTNKRKEKIKKGHQMKPIE